MAGLIGTATSAPTLLEDFMRVELDVIGACQTAIPALGGPDERALVVELRTEHEGQFDLLKRHARRLGVAVPEVGTENEARTIGRIKLARRRGGDGRVLEALDNALEGAATAYTRGLRNAALPETLKPVLNDSIESLEERRAAMREAARLAA